MPSFAVNRKQMNRGCGNGSGRWLFEEFMWSDSMFGRVEIEYDAVKIRTVGEERPSDVVITKCEVASLVVFDDDGNEVPLSADDYTKLSQIAIEAFVAVRDNVIDYEMERI